MMVMYGVFGAVETEGCFRFKTLGLRLDGFDVASASIYVNIMCIYIYRDNIIILLFKSADGLVIFICLTIQI